jgi:hypothetical protein
MAIAAGTVSEDRPAFVGVVRPDYCSRSTWWRCEHEHQDSFSAWQCARDELRRSRDPEGGSR